MKVKLLRRIGGLPFVRMAVEGHEGSVLALVDTGSEGTMVDTSVIGKDMGGKESMVRFRTVSGAREQPILECRLRISIAGREVDANVIATDMSGTAETLRKCTPTGRSTVKAIIGSDVLTMLKASVDMDNGELEMADVAEPLLSASGGRLYAANVSLTYDFDVTVRARNIKDAAWRAVHGMRIDGKTEIRPVPIDTGVAAITVKGEPTVALKDKEIRLIKNDSAERY